MEDWQIAQQLFRLGVDAIAAGKLISRASSQDKEYHFQNWFKGRLDESGYNYDSAGRNTYPDFGLVGRTIGFELKGLAYPGREVNYDSNSQVPTGYHNGRSVYYVFGRYPSKPDGNTYPVLDLVICHGDFLNADHEYVHKNKSIKGFGSYGDIMIRDRKMYVAPTPFGIASGLAHQQTLILPTEYEPGDMELVGSLDRQEAAELIVGYSFDLQTNEIKATKIPNPNKGRVHSFRAWRINGVPQSPVALRTLAEIHRGEDLVDQAEALEEEESDD